MGSSRTDGRSNALNFFERPLRPEIKARWDDAGRDDFIDYIATLGFQFSFGGAQAVASQPAAQSAPAAVAAQVVAAPVDADADGVSIPTDRCPDTPRGVAVDDTGCTQQGSITLAGVHFENDSAILTRDSLPALDRVAADLKKHPRLEIELQGHTDSVGSDRYNLRLSQQRADAVRAYLLSKGVQSAQTVARGLGESSPVGDNGATEGRAQNRRVVMLVLQNPGDVEIKGE